MFAWGWDENHAKTVLEVGIKFVGCAMEVVFDMELNDAITAKEEDVKIAATAMDKDRNNVPHVMGNSSFWFTSTSLLNGLTTVMITL